MNNIFFAKLPIDNSPIMVKYGEQGYWPAHPITAERRIAQQGPELTEAALIGSMFGWRVPAAKLARDAALGDV